MKKTGLKIGTQLNIGSIIILLLVVVLGIVTYIQTNELYKQAEALFEHPFYVREAVDEMIVNIHVSRVAIRDMVLTDDKEKQTEAEQLIEVSFANISSQFDVIYARYLGPVSDIDEAYGVFIDWKTATEDRIHTVKSGDVEGVAESLGDGGYVGAKRVQMIAKVEVIGDYSKNKVVTLFNEYIALNRSLNIQSIALILVIFLLSVIISYVLVRKIRKPLDELNSDIKRFHQGNLSVRSSYTRNDEFGMLANSFNEMAEAIQVNNMLDKKVSDLSTSMLREEDANEFFKSMLAALAEHTCAQMAAVYLLSKDKKRYVHFESIGLAPSARESFDADELEGEFGKAVISRKWQYIKKIPEDTRFVHLTPGGEFTPREIITIPIVSGEEIIAVISLACLEGFSPHTSELIDDILVTMSARIEGVIAYRTIKEFGAVLEQQNRELDAQKNELSAQAAELSQQNTELDIQKKELTEASMLKTHFLSNMSHELRTPLNSIIALSGVLNRRLDKQIPDEECSYLEVIERNGKHLLAMINDILDISRIESGREEIRISEFDANQTIEDIVTLIEAQASQKGIELIQKKISPDVKVASDVEKLRHILQNIIGNAIKFTDTGKVEVEPRKKGDMLEITVTDTGIGISEEHLPFIFDEFRQADTGTARRYGGTGLGLAIAKKYAHLLGGDITVSSKVGKGSEFAIEIPIKYNQNIIDTNADTEVGSLTEPITNKPENIGNKLSDKKILLIEDSDSAIIQIKDLLEDSGLKVAAAHSAMEAFELMKEELPNAIILDLMMPDVDGFDVLKTLRENKETEKMPVIILTAKHITNEDLSSLKKNNVKQLIQKGDVNRVELLNAVVNMLAPELFNNKRQNPEKPHKKKKPDILIVEDNADNMITIDALLRDKFNVIKAEDGESGIMMARKHMPDLILMDIGLPGINGITSFKEIRKYVELQHVPIVALTASVMPNERESILAEGFDAFIAKPIIIDDLMKAISEVLYGN